MMYEWDGDINKGTENIKRKQKEILVGNEKWNNWNKNWLERFKSKCAQAELKKKFKNLKIGQL